MKAKNITWGIFFILMSVFIILGAMDVFGDISVWTCIFAGFCIVWLINGVIKFSFGNMLFPVAFLAILFDESLGIEELTPWPVLAAALFGTIGLNMIFSDVKRKRRAERKKLNEMYNQKMQDSMHSDEKFVSSVTFGSIVKYVNSQKLKFANIDTAFGSSTIYFDNTQLDSAQATVKLATTFGKTVLYVPKDWNVNVNVTKAFAGITEKGECTPEGINRLMIVGSVSFGKVEVIYV